MDTVGVDVGSWPGLFAVWKSKACWPTPTGTADGSLVAAVADRPERPVEQVARLRDLAGHGRLALLRVTPSSTSTR